jgi:hypothetical protein
MREYDIAMLLKKFAYKIRAKVNNAATSGMSGLQWFKAF